ncbi:MAG TPA: class I SAM-dependent methyltransferase [Anaerolineales bacterium]|nr:class I SAM-dependent methyltransferase [Anaerolineales bacterium]
MPFYDNYFSRSESISRAGTKIIAREVQNRIRLSQELSSQSTLKTLEFGPGRGHFARAVLSLGWEYRAVDGSASVSRLLREEGIEVIQAFVPPMPEDAGGGYDLVLMEHFIEHMDSPASARDLVDSVHRSLSERGLILIVSPDYLAHRSNFWDCDYTHSFVTTIQRLRQLLLDCNYEVRYAGYETLGIQNAFATWLISELTNLIFLTRFPQLMSLHFTGSTDLSNKWKNVLLRSCVIVGQKRS